MRLEAFNNVVCIVKDHGDDGNPNKPSEVPAPYTGVIESIGVENDDFKLGDRVVFSDVGGLFYIVDEIEYVIISPDNIIGIV